MPTPIIQGYGNLTTLVGPEVPYRFVGQVFRIDAIDPTGMNRPLAYQLIQGAGLSLSGNVVSQTSPRASEEQVTVEVRVSYATAGAGDYPATWLLTMMAVNEPPVFQQPKSLRPDGSTTRVGYGEQGTLVLQVIAGDPEATPITYGFADTNTVGGIMDTSGPFKLEPNGTMSVLTPPPLGIYALNVRAVDEGGAYTDRVFSIESVNRPPVDLHVENLIGGKGAIVQLRQPDGPVLRLAATDLDQSPIEYQLLAEDGVTAAVIPGITLDPVTGILSFDRTAAVPGYYPAIMVAGDPSSIPVDQRAESRVPVTIQIINDKPGALLVDDVSQGTAKRFLVRIGDPDVPAVPPVFGFANQDGTPASQYRGWTITATGLLTPDATLPTGSYALPIRVEDAHHGITIHWINIPYDAAPTVMLDESVQQVLQRLDAAGRLEGDQPNQKPQRYPVVTLRRSTAVEDTGKTQGPLLMTTAYVNEATGALVVHDTQVIEADAVTELAKRLRAALESTENLLIAGADLPPTKSADTLVQQQVKDQRGQTVDTPPQAPQDPPFPGSPAISPPTGYEPYR